MNTGNLSQRRRRRDRAGGAFAQLRSQYFARAAEAAARYSVNFDDIVEHLWHARQAGIVVPVSLIVYVDDLVHAVSLCSNSETAWADMRDIYERWLIRKFRNRLTYTEALLEVRGLFAVLRHEQHARACHVDSLRCYLGLAPMQLWLVERFEHRLAERHVDAGPSLLDEMTDPLDQHPSPVLPFPRSGALG